MQKLKDAIADRLVALINNPHTSGSALVYGALKLAGLIWPVKKPLLDEIASAAIIWLGVSARDASKSATKEDIEVTKQQVAVAIDKGDTSLLKKSDVPPPANVTAMPKGPINQ